MLSFDNGHKLTPKQINALPLLAAGVSGKEVASAINVNPATVSQWINHNQDFKEALTAFSASSLSIAGIQLEALAIDAIAELRRLLVDAKSEQVRLKAVELTLGAVGLSEARKFNNEGSDKWSFVTDAGKYDFNKLVKSLTGG